MERRDPTLMVARGILGLVLAGLGAIAALRINAEGGFDGLRGGPASPGGWGFGDDPDRGECIELAEALATGGNPWDGEVSTRDDSATETVDGVERGWSVHESRYGDSAAAESAFEALQVLDSPGMKACFQEELEVLEFPGTVEDGYGTGDTSSVDGIREQAYYAVWRDGERVLSFTAYATTEDDISDWVREEYKGAREEWD